MLIQVPTSLSGFKTATVRRWLKAINTPVKTSEVVVELEVEDAIIALQSPADGTLTRITAPPGTTLPPGGDLGTLELGTVSEKSVTPSTATTSAPTGIPILMPQAGNTMEEGTLLKWRVKVGDVTTVGQVICDVETDKATVEVEATAAGTIAWLAPEGSVIPVKQPIALLGDTSISQLPAAPLAAPPRPKHDVVAQVAPTPARPPSAAFPLVPPAPGRIKASPAARKLAQEKGIDLATLNSASGPGGRILSTDLALATPSHPLAPVPQVTGAKEVVSPIGSLSSGRKTLSKMRKAIALNLQTSKQTIPHFYVKLTINADPLFTFYRAHKPATGCTLNDVLLLAVGQAVAEFPPFRSRLEGHDLIETPAAHIGVAVSVPDGLVVPVILNVQTLTLAQLATEAKRVVEAARNGKIENFGKAVFTISNMGMLGVEDFSAIINPPESGILAISAVREAVIVQAGTMRPGRVMSMTLSVDHRVVDGALAAQFMNRLRELLETPEKLIN